MNLCLGLNTIPALAGPELAEAWLPDQTHSNEEAHLLPSIQLLSLHLQMAGMLLGVGRGVSGDTSAGSERVLELGSCWEKKGPAL